MSDVEPGEDEQGPGNALTTEERRKRVYDLLVRGFPHTTIAKLLDVHRNTIGNDVKAIQAENRSKVANTDPVAEIGDHDRFLSEIETAAMFEYHSLQDEREDIRIQNPDGSYRIVKKLIRSNAIPRGKMLELALKTRCAKLEMQLKTGVIPKVADTTDDEVFVMEGIDIRKVSLEALKEMREKKLRKTAGKHGLRVINGTDE